MTPELTLVRNAGPDQAKRSTPQLRDDLQRSVEALLAFVEAWSTRPGVSFKEFEMELRAAVFAIARIAIVLFLCLRDERLGNDRPRRVEVGSRRFRSAPAIARSLTTLFGVVRYKRTYMREVADGPRNGFFPLDVDLGLTADRLSTNVLSRAVLLATKLSFSEARSTLLDYVPNAPSTEVIEQAVLGLGRYAGDWFQAQPAPEGDGNVLVVMVDSKGAPMATSVELARRRGKRRKCGPAPSARHRGRSMRKRHPKKPRRAKGDKSKNAKMATLVVMYTLERQGKKLLGPINRRVYASFAPKRYAFEVARREADKRGFSKESGKLVQIVTDGDSDLATYAAQFFPGAIHTVDIIHVIEKLWKAGESLYREGSQQLKDWVENHKALLYAGDVEQVLHEIVSRRDSIPKTGPGNKGKRKRLGEVAQYLVNRGPERMNYDELLQRDLEISSGMVEGAIKNVIGRRFDHGGSRWIKERAEALLNLRCIAVNGDWDAFVNYVHDRMRREAADAGRPFRLQSREAMPLPTHKEAA